MSGLGVFILGPTAGVTVGRSLTVQGSVPVFLGAVNSMDIVFPGGASATIRPPPGSGFGRGGGSWFWQGLVPNTVRPGQAFTITVRAFGTMVTKTGPEPETMEVDGSASLSLVLENVVPILSVDPFQSPIVTRDGLYQFTLSGTFREAGAPYAPQLQYQIGSGAPVSIGLSDPVNGCAWSVKLQLGPLSYPITVTASDNFASSVVVKKTLTVLHYLPPDHPDPTLPKTLAGIPTSSSVTSWTRLEPQCAAADMGETSAARVFDPLWLMTRQWQVGEFQGEDTGSPVQVRVRATHATLSRSHFGELSDKNTKSVKYNPGQAPLEALVERRSMRPAGANDVRMLPLAVDAGLHFLRMLDLDPVGARYRAAFLKLYAMAPLTARAAAAADPDTLRFVDTMAGRAPDARLLATALKSAKSKTFHFDASLGIAAADAAAVQQIAVAWLAFYNGLFTEPATTADDAWVPARLEYALSTATRLSAAAQDDLTLTAREFDGGRLEWSSFDVNTQVRLATTGDKSFAAQTVLTIPAPVTIKGAPAPRFWEVEDAKVAYGLLSVGPTDLAHLMMIEYAHSYGNDWYVVPLTTPVGSVSRVESLVVTDTFGVRSLLRPIGDPTLPDPHFSMWQLSKLRQSAGDAPAPVANAFFLPPTLGRSLDGAVLEDVLFMRDEMANLAWGIERTIEGGAQTPVSLAGGAPQATVAPAPGTPPRYNVSTDVPANWIPLMPVQVDAIGTVQLLRAATLQPNGAKRPPVARSTVLNASRNLALYDEEVPREGVRVTRRRRLARWVDGSTVVWTAFRNDVGRGEGSAGLRFDQVEDEASS
jgi:hypothetical protein